MFSILLVIVSLLFAYLASRDFKSAVTILLALTPTYLIRFSVGPVPTTLLETFVLITIVIWFLREGKDLDYLKTLDGYRIPVLLLLAAACFGVVVAPDVYSALGVWKAFFIEPVMLFFVFRSTFTEREDWVRSLKALGVTVVAIALFALFQRLTGLGLPVPWDVELRATSFFDFPNAVGLFAAPIVSALIVLSAGKLERKDQLQAGIVITLGLMAAYLSQTEAVFVAIPAALIMALLFSHAAREWKIGVLIGAVILGGIALITSDTIREKVFLQDLSGKVRISQWKETFAMLRDHPVFGAGLSGYPTVFKPYHDPSLYEIFQYPHTLFLNFWVELGLLGVLALLAFLFLGGKLLWMKRGDVFVLAAFAALFTMLIHGMVDVPFFKNDLAIITAFFLAMTFAGESENTEEGKRM